MDVRVYVCVQHWCMCVCNILGTCTVHVPRIVHVPRMLLDVCTCIPLVQVPPPPH
jgi:hypothetical protein